MTPALLYRWPVAALRLNPVLVGAAGGLLAVLSWGGYLALVRAGVSEGVIAADFMVFRYGVAGLLTLPVLLWRREAVGRIGATRGLALSLAAGPVFLLFSVTGFHFAPLAHGSLIQPSVVTVGGLLLGAALLGERLTGRRIAGALLVLLGIGCVGGPGIAAGEGVAWIGDLCFVIAGGFWLTFTLLVRHWHIEALAGTAIVNGSSAAFVLPYYGFAVGFERLFALPLSTLVLQSLVQGVLSGGIAVIGYAFAVRQLGASRAALFPALVPATAMLIGVPVTGETPTPLQLLGLALATVGLFVALLSNSRSPSP